MQKQIHISGEKKALFHLISFTKEEKVKTGNLFDLHNQVVAIYLQGVAVTTFKTCCVFLLTFLNRQQVFTGKPVAFTLSCFHQTLKTEDFFLTQQFKKRRNPKIRVKITKYFLAQLEHSPSCLSVVCLESVCRWCEIKKKYQKEMKEEKKIQRKY